MAPARDRWRGEEDGPMRSDRRRTIRARPADTGRAAVSVVRLGQSDRQATDRARNRHNEQRSPTQVVQVADQAEPENDRPVHVPAVAVRRPRRILRPYQDERWRWWCGCWWRPYSQRHRRVRQNRIQVIKTTAYYRDVPGIFLGSGKEGEHPPSKILLQIPAVSRINLFKMCIKLTLDVISYTFNNEFQNWLDLKHRS